MGTKNTFENFVTSTNSSDVSTFSSPTYRGGSGGDSNPSTTTTVVCNQNQLVNVLSCGRVTTVTHPATPHNAATKLPSLQSSTTTTTIKHKLPMHVSRPSTGNSLGSIGVSVITPAVGVQSTQKEAFAAKHHAVQSLYPNSVQQPNLIGFSRNNAYTMPSASMKVVGGLQMSPVNNTPAKQKLSNSIAAPTAAFVPHSPYTQHMPRFLSSSKHLVNTDGDYYLNDDGTIADVVDKRAQYCSRFPPGYQHVLQDHSYSQLPESPPPPSITPPTLPQRNTINGLSRLPASSVGPTKGGVNIGSYPSGGRPSGLTSSPHVQNSISCGGYPSNLVNSTLGSGGFQNNGASVIAVNPRKGSQAYPSSLSLAQFSKSILRSGIRLDKPEESDLSEDDRLPDPHGEETETAPEAEGEEESVTRCICDFEHDDGYMIQCDKCSVWQHVVCMGIDWRRIPDEYQCEKCQPRYIDKRKAIDIQKKKLAGKLCIGANDESDSSDTPPTNSRNKKNQTTKRKYKQRRTTAGSGGNVTAPATLTTKRKNTPKDIKESAKPRKNAQVKKRPTTNNDSSGNLLVSGSGGPHSNMTPERKKQLLIERKQMLEKKQMTKKRSIRKQAQQNTKRNSEKNKQFDNDIEYKFGGPYVDRMDSASGIGGGAGEHMIQKVRDWVDRYEEAVTNHYSQELRARLSAVQVNGVHSDLKYTATLKSVEKCRTSLLSTGGKILLSTTSLSSNQAVIELRGKYMWTGALSFKQHNISPTSPYVFYYRLPKHDIEICVDCRTYGNFARFVRRSCKPNAELRHCVRKTSLHLYLIATQPLKKNSEILIGHYSPDTANTCVCGSPENCTAAKTLYPSTAVASVSAVTSKHYSDKLSKESQNIRSASPLLSDSNSKSKKTLVNSDKTKKKIVEEKKKLTKEKRRGRRKSPSHSNSDHESSSRDQSPLAPTKLRVNMWSKGSLGSSTITTEMNRKTEEKSTEDDATHAQREISSLKVREDVGETTGKMINASSDEKNGGAENVKTEPNWSSVIKSNAIERTNSMATTTTETTQTPKKGSRQTDYARKEKQQLDYPLFFQTPNNHKMTREEKKIQAIMKAFEQLEKTEARKQENQKHRRESTSDANDGKKMMNRKNATTTRSRKNTEESRDDEQQTMKGRKDAVKDEPLDDDIENDDDDEENENIEMTNGEMRVKQELSETAADDENTDDDDDDSDDGGGGEELPPVSDSKRSCKRNETPRRGGAKARGMKATRQVRCMPKARATAKTKITRSRKRKSESDPENEEDGEDSLDIGERTSGAILRNRNAQCGVEMHRRNAQASPLGKLRRQTDDPMLSPYSTPPKMRERLDSSSSSGGTPPTPVSDTCLLVAAAVGHLTDFKFPNTKKELMNAWFKEERKPSPEEENTGKQEGNNECAKKRWLRQAISEEGDSSVLRPEESISPNGDYGGPLKKRRFARESMSEHMDESSVLNALVNANQMSFDEDDDVSSPDAGQFRTGELDNVTSYQRVIPTPGSAPVMQTATSSKEVTKNVVEGQSLPPLPPTAPPPPPPPPPPPSSTPPPSPQHVEHPTTSATSPSSGENTNQKTSSPTIAKKKLSLTEYQKRKNVSSVSTVTTPSLENSAPVSLTNQEATATTPFLTNTLPISETMTVEREKRSPSRSSVTSSSASEDEDDDSHAASAQVIARSLMMESRHLMYGPQASALVNSLRSSSISSTTNSSAFGGAKSTTPNQNTTADIPRENLADRLKREFNVHVAEDDGDKIKGASPVSTIKTLVPMPSEMVRMKKPPLVAPSPSLPMPNMGGLSGAPQFLPPLPDAPQLFASPAYYSYPIAGVPPPFFAAPPPPPPPPLPVPPPSVTTSLAPPPPPPPQ